MSNILCYRLNKKDYYVVYEINDIKQFFTQDFIYSNFEKRVDIYIKVNELNNNDENGEFLFKPCDIKNLKYYNQIFNKNNILNLDNIKLIPIHY